MDIFEILYKSASIDSGSLTEANAGDFIFHSYIKDPGGKYISCNETQAVSFGLSKVNDLIGLRDHDLLNSNEANVLDENDKRVLITEKPHVYIEHATCESGKFMTATSFKSLLKSSAQNVIGVIGFSILQVDTIAPNKNNIFNLSRRQLDCLFYLVKGFTVKEISKKLNLSPRTIEHYLESIKQKLNCTRRSELFSKALLIPEIKARLLGIFPALK